MQKFCPFEEERNMNQISWFSKFKDISEKLKISRCDFLQNYYYFYNIYNILFPL